MSSSVSPSPIRCRSILKIGAFTVICLAIIWWISIFSILGEYRYQGTSLASSLGSDHSLSRSPSFASELGLSKPKPFQFYVYESLPEQYGVHNISNCIEQRIGTNADCGWGLNICVEKRDAHPRYVSWRHNHNADVALADLFQRYPYPKDYDSSAAEFYPATANFASRTDNANEADLFVVPYAHDSHCKCVVGNTWCTRRVDKEGRMDAHLDAIFGSLSYYNETSAPRHLFLSSSDFPFVHERMNRLPVRTTLGDLRTPECTEPKSLCGHVVIPYMNTVPDYQPAILQQRRKEWWTTRKRKYSVAAVYGMIGENPEVTSDRNEFLRRKDELFGANVSGLPVHIDVLGRGRTLQKEQQVLDLYQNSTFCIILPGDGPCQKRFFDAIMSGCIPVVISFPVTSDPGIPAWWKNSYANQTKSIRVSYPFPQGIFGDIPSVGIDYPSLVVQTCGLECIKPTLERVMANETELLRLRQNLRRHAALFSYGLEANSHRYFDAFAVVLAQLGHYLQRLSDKESKKRASQSENGED